MPDDQGNGHPLNDAQLDELAVLLHELLRAETLYAKQRLVEGNPLLLRREADFSLAALVVQYEENPALHRSLEMHRRLLQRCREIGVQEAFLELRRQMDAGAERTLGGEALEALIDTIGEFVTAENWTESRRWLDEHPELISPEADAVFDELIRTYERRNQLVVTRQLMIHRDLLRACREIGIDEAFERMLNPPDTLDLLAENTIAVMTVRGDERTSWLETVRLIRVRAAELDDQPMLALLRAINGLLDGAAPADLAPTLEGPYAVCWERIVKAIDGPSS